jgi:hypothetical protein
MKPSAFCFEMTFCRYAVGCKYAPQGSYRKSTFETANEYWLADISHRFELQTMPDA